MSFLDELRAAVPLHIVASDLLDVEIDAARETKVPCVRPSSHTHGAENPNLTVNGATGLYWCHCGAQGDVVQLAVERGRATDTAGAIRFLREKYRVGDRAAAHGASSSVSTGGAPQFPYYPETAKRLGWTLAEAGGVVWASGAVYDHAGERVATKVRGPRDERGAIRARVEAYGATSGPGMIGDVPSIETALPGDLVFVVCGEPDYWCLKHAADCEGVPVIAVSHSNGENASFDIKEKRAADGSLKREARPIHRLLAGLHVVYVGDRDDAGIACAERRVAEFPEALKVTNFVLPFTAEQLSAGCKDLRDWLERCGGSIRALMQLVAATQPPLAASNSEVVSPSPRDGRRKWKPFPVHTLPEPVRSFVVQKSKALGCDPAFVALPVLGVLAAAIGNSRTIRLKAGWPEPSVLWTAVVAESGTLKSPAHDGALAPLRRRQDEAFVRHAEAMKEYWSATTIHKAQLAKWKKGGSHGTPPQPPERPVAERFIVSDITVEALAVRLQAAPRGLLLARDELAGWVKSFDAYKKGKGGDESQWLMVHGARGLIVDRKTGDHETIHVPRAAVSITGAIQPAVLRDALGREHFQSGLAARILVASPPRQPKRWTDAVVDPRILDAYETLVDRLLDLAPASGDSKQMTPVEVAFDDAAYDAWIEFYDRHGRRQNEAVGDEAAMLSKIEGSAARLMLVVYSVRSVTDEAESLGVRADAASARAGIEMAEWFADEAERLYEEFRRSPAELERDEILGWIARRGGRVTVRDAMLGPRRLRTDSETARRALDELVALGFAVWEPTTAGPKGGRPTDVFVLRGEPTEKSGEQRAATATEPSDPSLSHEVVSPEVAASQPDEAVGAAGAP